jgi:hypothetical protein
MNQPFGRSSIGEQNLNPLAVMGRKNGRDLRLASGDADPTEML